MVPGSLVIVSGSFAMMPGSFNMVSWKLRQGTRKLQWTARDVFAFCHIACLLKGCCSISTVPYILLVPGSSDYKQCLVLCLVQVSNAVRNVERYIRGLAFTGLDVAQGDDDGATVSNYKTVASL